MSRLHYFDFLGFLAALTVSFTVVLGLRFTVDAGGHGQIVDLGLRYVGVGVRASGKSAMIYAGRYVIRGGALDDRP